MIESEFRILCIKAFKLTCFIATAAAEAVSEPAAAAAAAAATAAAAAAAAASTLATESSQCDYATPTRCFTNPH